MKYRILVAYDGTDYHGWQDQLHGATVSGTLRQAFLEAFSLPIVLLGASRTDAGVHALGQVAHLETELSIDPEDLVRIWNGRLPRDIIVRKALIASNEFHALKNVKEKVYYYHFFTQRPLPFIARYGVFYRLPIDIEKLNASLKVFVGTHDFRSFCTGDEKESTIRTIDAISVIYLKRYKTYRIIVQGKGFLRFMIRRIVGAALHCAARPEKEITLLSLALAEKNPQQHLPTAASKGLVLRKIIYNNYGW